jgi:hypothetical protein
MPVGNTPPPQNPLATPAPEVDVQATQEALLAEKRLENYDMLSTIMAKYNGASAGLATSAANLNGAPEIDLIREQWPWVALDNFDQNFNGWTETTIEDSSQGTRFYYFSEGKYLIDFNAINPGTSWATSSITPVQNFYASIDVDIDTHISNGSPPSAGLTLRGNASGHYRFEITENGYFVVGYYDFLNAQWIQVHPWTFTPAISPSFPNQLAVIAVDDEMLLYINGQLVGSVVGTFAVEGSVEPLVSVYAPGDSVTVTFDNYELRVP